MKHSGLSTFAGFVAIVLWSTTIAFARSLSEQLGSLTAAAAVYVIGGTFCLARLYTSSHLSRGLFALSRKYLLGCGALFVLYTVLLYVAVGMATDREQVLEIGLLNYLWPASTIWFSLWLLRKRANLLLVPGTVLALAGICLVMTQGVDLSWPSFVTHVKSNPVAYSFAVAAAMSWALYSNLTRLWAAPDSGGAVELFIPVTGLVLVGMRLLTSEPTRWTARGAIEAALLGGITALAYVLWDLAMRKGDLLLVAAGAYFTPLLSTIVTCVYLGVLPGPLLWVGCLLLVGGSLVSWRSVA